ncbi:uncharacterized protein LOC108604787 [Drosophila busckii]|nr:uncharacterized protein LOC108604787 [Drosophila busckii]
MAAKTEVNYKFPMHGTHMRKTMGNVRTACILSLIAPLIFYFAHNVTQKNAYANFYSKYDPMYAFDRMKTAGYLDSCPKEEKCKDDKKKDKKK